MLKSAKKSDGERDGPTMFTIKLRPLKIQSCSDAILVGYNFLFGTVQRRKCCGNTQAMD
jgi:hypothetical protein